MLAGCGPSFEVGDEAWVELPGASPLWDEYAIVEVRSFSDGQARVELVERIRVLDHLEGRMPWFKRRNARELLSRLEGGEPAWVAEDDLIAPEDGELDAEAKREIFRQGLSWVWLGAEGLGKDFSTLPSPEGVEEALALAGRRGLDDEARALELTMELLDIAVEAFGGYEAPDAAIEGADAVREFADAVREGAGVVRERLADDPLAGRRLLNAMENDQAKLWRGLMESRRTSPRRSLDAVMGTIFGGSSGSGSEAELPRELEAIVGSWEWHAASTAIDLLVLLEGELASALERQLKLADSADEAVDAAAAALAASESVADLVTMDGGRRFRDESRREIVERSERSLALAVAKGAFGAAGEEAAERESDDSAEALLGRARGFASAFDGTLDLEPVWGEVEAQHHEGAAQSLESEVRAALNEPDLKRASAAMARYLSASRTLGSLHARRDRGKLNGASPGEFAEGQGRRLARSVQYRLRPAAEAFLGFGSSDFDSAAHGERIPRLRALMEPFDAALGGEALDGRFFAESREVAKANDNRRFLGVGQVWTGALLCGEATRYQRYREGSSSYGARYHGPERLALTLELTEAKNQGARVQYQGMLTAQNLPSEVEWRHRNPQTGTWARTARPESTQFVVLSYDTRNLAVTLFNGAVDRAAHIERHGKESYVRDTEGDWQAFNGSGSLDPSKPAISGRIDRRTPYIDRTCSEFTLSPSGPAGTASELVVEDAPGPSEGPGAGEGSAGDGWLPELSGLAEQTYLGGMKKRGMKVFALSADGEWCGRSVTLKIEAESGDVFSDGTADFYMRRFGERINDEDFCPSAKVAEIVGFAGAGPEPCFSGRAEAHEWRIVSGGGGAQCD